MKTLRQQLQEKYEPHKKNMTDSVLQYYAISHNQYTEIFLEVVKEWLEQKRHTQLKNGSMYDIHTLDELLEDLEK